MAFSDDERGRAGERSAIAVGAQSAIGIRRMVVAPAPRARATMSALDGPQFATGMMRSTDRWCNRLTSTGRSMPIGLSQAALQ